MLHVDPVNTIIRAPRVADIIYDKLRALIVAGQITAGTPLSVPGLATEFGVSRSPAREAVQHLVADGLAGETPHIGVRVSEITPADLVALYDVRAALDAMAAGLAATVSRARTQTSDALQAALQSHVRAVSAGDLDAHFAADLALHAKIAELAGNKYLEAHLAQIQAMVSVAMHTTVIESGPLLALRDHKAIVGAIVEGNSRLAQQRAFRHVARLANTLLRHCPNTGAAHAATRASNRSRETEYRLSDVATRRHARST